MQDTVPMPLDGNADDDAREFTIRFTGSGSEYFRIWIVNLLLTLVTLGLYHPWAVVRKRRYFYGNTLVGDHAFDFHGNPTRMLRGYLLMAVLAALYALSGHVSTFATLVALGAVAVLWPALFRASQQFRMANTSWRGLRFHFTGGLGQAYVAVLPLLLPALAFAAASSLLPTDPEATAAAEASGLVTIVGVMLTVVGLASMVAGPLAFWLLKRYQHNHYALGSQRTSLALGVGRLYGLAIKTVLLSMLVMFLAGIVAAVLFGVSGAFGSGGRGISVTGMIIGALVAFLFYAVMFATIQPYAVSRLQNMLWSATSSAPVLRLTSALTFGASARLGLKNFVFTVLTLGLYWPFAAVALARLRLEAVTVHLPRGAEGLTALARSHHDAAGEAAGDLFGIDIGL